MNCPVDAGSEIRRSSYLRKDLLVKWIERYVPAPASLRQYPIVLGPPRTDIGFFLLFLLALTDPRKVHGALTGIGEHQDVAHPEHLSGEMSRPVSKVQF